MSRPFFDTNVILYLISAGHVAGDRFNDRAEPAAMALPGIAMRRAAGTGLRVVAIGV